MLTRLRFKNWRSLKDVTIDNLTPITVFIGANSSGKTNIVEGLDFLRRIIRFNSRDSILFGEDTRPIRTLGSLDEVAIEVDYQRPDAPTLRYKLEIEQRMETHFKEWLTVLSNPQSEIFHALDGFGKSFNDIKIRGGNGLAFAILGYYLPLELADYSYIGLASQFAQLLGGRLQYLAENFAAAPNSPLSVAADYFTVQPNGANTLDVLRFIQQSRKSAYTQLVEDYHWLLSHVEAISLTVTERETRLKLKEVPLQGQESPTISFGSLRVLSMLTAYYALELGQSELPGLVVIEEPDTALNPGLLQNFVEQLRNYVSRHERPRQFILTTHNPSFLDYFEPEEVQIVERGDDGLTSVHKISDSVKNIMLKDFSLGDAWKTRIMGGVPE